MTRISNDRHGPFLPQTWVGWGERTSCSQSAHVRYLAGRSTLRVLLNPLFTTGSPSLGSSHNHQSPGNVHVLKVEHAPNLPMPLQFLPLSCLPGRANAGPVQRNLPPPPQSCSTLGGVSRGGGGYWALVQGGLAGQEKYAPALRTSHTLCVSAILRDQSLARTGGAFFAKCRPSCLRCLQARSQHINTEGQGAGGQGAWYGESLIHLCTHSL